MQKADGKRGDDGPQGNLSQHGQGNAPATMLSRGGEHEADGEGADVLRENDEDLHHGSEAGEGEGHERDAVVAGVVKHRRQLQGAGLFAGVFSPPANEHAKHEHAADDGGGEAHDACRLRSAERRVYDMHEHEGRHEQVDVQLDQGADVEPRPAIKQPAQAEEDEDRQEDLGEDGPEEHSGKVRLSPKNKKRER